ncbi:hypothetical protein FSP39_013244 [Pinctada imbricata]|uniref:OCEL domain-containing protein n=1 Tax=Pinctada imbricata TaxID=66713 RepID=A0AA88Y930_PINIB|nr:hypothetical protein FSP39_013244 [Pinctada imbricata]
MFQKLTVHATAEVFDKTRQDVKTAQEEWEKIRTQEIKPSGPNISKRIRRHIKPDQRSSHTSGRNMSDLSKKIQDAKRESELRTAALSQPTKAPPSAIKPKTAVVPPFTNSDSNRSIVSSSTNNMTSLSPHQGSSVVSSTSALRSQAVSSSSIGSSAKPSGNSALRALPLRDRIIHLLVLNSYKKPEIYVKLNKDGLDDEDKLKFESTLKEVGTVITQSKDARYTLAKHAFCDVRPEWPFYSSREREIVKKKIQSLSPATSPANQPSPGSPPGLQKRPIDSTTDQQQQPVPKKQRIAHNRKENNKPPTIDRYSSSKDRQHKKENIDESTEASSTSEYPDYIAKYISISDAAQRAKYKQDFNTEYDEYKALHKNVEKVTKKFAELESLIRRTQPGSHEYEDLKNRIKNEYRHQKGDPKYTEQKKRFDYLHQKLGHIKQLIVEFDNSHAMCS